jgi:hypothetical protein
VVKKRSDFEYRLRRRTADKDDFIRYIQYEMTLEKLLAVRCRRKFNFLHSISSVDHMHFLFAETQGTPEGCRQDGEAQLLLRTEYKLHF